MKRLWDISHPYYGVDGYTERVNSFDELRQHLDHSDADLNVIYRWDWTDLTDPVHDDQGYTDEERQPRFTVYLITPRKAGFWAISCPISREQEPEVLEWLRGPRVLGYLRKLWAPLLDTDARPAEWLTEQLLADDTCGDCARRQMPRRATRSTAAAPGTQPASRGRRQSMPDADLTAAIEDAAAAVWGATADSAAWINADPDEKGQAHRIARAAIEAAAPRLLAELVSSRSGDALDLTHIQDAVAKVKAHDHPGGADYYCLNLLTWLGERAHLLVDEIERLRGEASRIKAEALRQAADQLSPDTVSGDTVGMCDAAWRDCLRERADEIEADQLNTHTRPGP